MQTKKADLDFYLINLPPGLDAWFGDSWLRKHKASLSYKQRCVHLKKEKKGYTLQFEEHEHLPDPPDRTNVCLLSVVQVKKMLKKEQCMTFLVT